MPMKFYCELWFRSSKLYTIGYNYLKYLNQVNHMEIERIKGISALINETVIVMGSMWNDILS